MVSLPGVRIDWSPHSASRDAKPLGGASRRLGDFLVTLLKQNSRRALGGQVAAAIGPPERRGTKECNVLRAIAAVVLASAASLASATVQHPADNSASALDSSAPWWERVTVTIAGDGQPQSCRFESSLGPQTAKDCQVMASQAAVAKSATGVKDQYTRITFERRFSPSWQPDATKAPAGDMLLGRQVMSLAIGARGTVQGCEIVSASGDMRPEYGCKEASAERFSASAASIHSAPRQGYMTILVYGHQEHVV
jgi:hypothetical protein